MLFLGYRITSLGNRIQWGEKVSHFGGGSNINIKVSNQTQCCSNRNCMVPSVLKNQNKLFALAGDHETKMMTGGIGIYVIFGPKIHCPRWSSIYLMYIQEWSHSGKIKSTHSLRCISTYYYYYQFIGIREMVFARVVHFGLTLELYLSCTRKRIIQ